MVGIGVCSCKKLPEEEDATDGAADVEETGCASVEGGDDEGEPNPIKGANLEFARLLFESLLMLVDDIVTLVSKLGILYSVVPAGLKIGGDGVDFDVVSGGGELIKMLDNDASDKGVVTGERSSGSFEMSLAS